MAEGAREFAFGTEYDRHRARNDNLRVLTVAGQQTATVKLQTSEPKRRESLFMCFLSHRQVSTLSETDANMSHRILVFFGGPRNAEIWVGQEWVWADDRRPSPAPQTVDEVF